MLTQAASSVSSTQRPIPLRVRPDLVVSRIAYQGIGSYVVKDPVGLKYHRLHAEQYRVLQLLDGQRNLEAIREQLRRDFPATNLSLRDVQNLIADLHRKGLAHSNRPGQGLLLVRQQVAERRKKMWGAVKNFLYLRLPGWDPERTLRAIYPAFAWMFRPWAVAAAVLLAVSAWTLLLVQFDEFRSRLPEFQQFFGWPNLIYLWLTLAAAKVIHEFGHGLTCTHYGGECHEMGVMLLVLSPTLYCDVTDSWMMPNKWHRIWIGAAGMYIEVILSALAIFVWWFTTPGLLNHLALNVFFVTTITTVIFNANPLMRLDGYYMMSDWLEVPNLRQKSDKLLRDTFAWYCLGIESPHDPFMPERRKELFVLYSIAAALYRWFIIFAIALFFYVWLKPYELQSIGATLAICSVAGIVFSLIFNTYHIIAAPRTEPMSYRKLAITLTAAGALLAAALAIPLPLHIEAAFVIQPHQVQHVFNSEPGRLAEMRVEPGAAVSAGDVLSVLENDELQDQYLTLTGQRDAQEKVIRRYLSLGDHAQEYLATARLNSLEKQIAELERRRSQLVIRAPEAGRVVAPPDKPRPNLEQTRHQLDTWHGTPLDRQNLGCFLEERTHLLSIAPNEQREAVLVVDQEDRNDLEVGQTVELKFDHLPDRTYTGTIEKISVRHLEYAPKALSTKYGGQLPTVTDAEGQERLTSIAYQATVLLADDTSLLRAGMTGKARFSMATRSAGDWLWRYLRRTFHFRL